MSTGNAQEFSSCRLEGVEYGASEQRDVGLVREQCRRAAEEARRARPRTHFVELEDMPHKVGATMTPRKASSCVSVAGQASEKNGQLQKQETAEMAIGAKEKGRVLESPSESTPSCRHPHQEAKAVHPRSDRAVVQTSALVQRAVRGGAIRGRLGCVHSF